MKNNRLIITLIALFILGFGLNAQTAPTEETAAQKEKRMEWFSQAKLGIFIHWGIYAVNGVSESWSFSTITFLMKSTWLRRKDLRHRPTILRNG